MRLTILSSMRGYAWAGSECLWQAMAVQALAAGHTVKTVIHADMMAADPVRELGRRGASVNPWRCFPVARFEPLRQALLPTFSWKALGRPEAVLVSVGSPTALLAVPGLLTFLQRSKVPYLLLLQFNSEYVFLAPHERECLAPIWEEANQVVCVSRANAKLLERQLNIDLRGKHEVVCNPVMVESDGPMASPAIETLRLACVARLETYWKCQDILLDTLAKPQWADRAWELRLYGSGPDGRYLEDRVRRLQLTRQVRLMGHESDRQKIWEANHVLVLPSRGEGTPLAALEAMMCGRPVIATPVGGIPEAVVDGLSGYLAESIEADAVAAVLERAYADRWRWEEVGLAGHMQAKAHRACDPAKRLLKLVEAIAS